MVFLHSVAAMIKMTDFSKLVETFPKLDSLGRKNYGWSKAGPGRNGLGVAKLSEHQMIRMDLEMKNAVIKAATKKGVKVGSLIRDYIEWGLENDE